MLYLTLELPLIEPRQAGELTRLAVRRPWIVMITTLGGSNGIRCEFAPSILWRFQLTMPKVGSRFGLVMMVMVE